jgi:hypothetical protein
MLTEVIVEQQCVPIGSHSCKSVFPSILHQSDPMSLLRKDVLKIAPVPIVVKQCFWSCGLPASWVNRDRQADMVFVAHARARRTPVNRCRLYCFCWVTASIVLMKRRSVSTRLHSATSQIIATFMLIAMRISDQTVLDL